MGDLAPEADFDIRQFKQLQKLGSNLNSARFPQLNLNLDLVAHVRDQKYMGKFLRVSRDLLPQLHSLEFSKILQPFHFLKAT